jgi:hypothetical protein
MNIPAIFQDISPSFLVISPLQFLQAVRFLNAEESQTQALPANDLLRHPHQFYLCEQGKKQRSTRYKRARKLN